MVFSIFKSKKRTSTQYVPEEVKSLERKLKIKFPKVYNLSEEEVERLKEEEKTYQESLSQNDKQNSPSSLKVYKPQSKEKEQDNTEHNNYMTKPTPEEYNEILRIRKEAKNNNWSKEDQKEWEHLISIEQEQNKKTKIGNIIKSIQSKNNSQKLDDILSNDQPIINRLELFGVPRTEVSSDMYNRIKMYQELTMKEGINRCIEENESVFYEFVKQNANGKKTLNKIIYDFESTVIQTAKSFEKILELEENYSPEKTKGTYGQKQEAFKKAKKYIIDNNLENGFLIFDEYKAKTRRTKKDGSRIYQRMPGVIIKLRNRKNAKYYLAKKFAQEKTDGKGLDLSFCENPKDIEYLINVNYLTQIRPNH